MNRAWYFSEQNYTIQAKSDFTLAYAQQKFETHHIVFFILSVMSQTTALSMKVSLSVSIVYISFVFCNTKHDIGISSIHQSHQNKLVKLNRTYF